MVLTLVSLAALCWVVFSIFFSKTDVVHDDLVWDGNLREGKHPAPIWWFWFIFVALVFSLIYLILYPGLGPNPGLLNWSSGLQVVHDNAAYEAEFGPRRQQILAADLRDIQADAKAMASAQGIFNRNCAVCHGYEAQGQAKLFPNLKDDDWQWGGSAEQIEQTIRGGRVAAMVAWGPVVGDQGVADLANYVLALSAGSADDHPAKVQFMQFCSACHGPDGTGNPLLGAPNLTDTIWLYGGDIAAVTASIAHGRTGTMPAFGERLDDTQIKLLLALLTPPD